MKLDTFEPQISEYHYFHCQHRFQHPKARRPSGGIAALIKNELYQSKTVSIAKANERNIWLKIRNQTMKCF